MSRAIPKEKPGIGVSRAQLDEVALGKAMTRGSTPEEIAAKMTKQLELAANRPAPKGVEVESPWVPKPKAEELLRLIGIKGPDRVDSVYNCDKTRVPEGAPFAGLEIHVSMNTTPEKPFKPWDIAPPTYKVMLSWEP